MNYGHMAGGIEMQIGFEVHLNQGQIVLLRHRYCEYLRLSFNPILLSWSEPKLLKIPDERQVMLEVRI